VSTEGESFFFASQGFRLHALRYLGRGERPVVVVPGITTPAAGFATIAATVADLPEVSEVCVLDMRGRGRSERVGPGHHSARDYAEDVLALIEATGLERPLLAGHSLGARVAVAARVAAPDRSSGVLAIDPVMSSTQRPYPTQLDHFLLELKGAKEGRGLEQARARFPSFSQQQLEQRVAALATCDEVAIIESFAWFHLETFEPWWAAVTPPALLLAGDQSPAVTAEDLVALKRLNPQARVALAERSGHMVPWDNLDRCLAAISALLRGATTGEQTPALA
jgi:N-formylmaleamate deformylase